MQPGPCPCCLIALLNSPSSGLLSAWSHSRIVFPPLSELTPSQRHFCQSEGKGEARIWGFQGISKEFASGNLSSICLG